MMGLKTNLMHEARRIQEDANHSARSHFVEALQWRSLHLWIGIPTAIAAAVSGLAALTQFDNHNIIAGVLALFVAASTAVITFLNPQQQTNAHQDAGSKYLALRNQARIFREVDCSSQQSDAELTTALKRLARRRDVLNQTSLPIPRRAYTAARRGIEEGETRYEVDAQGESGANIRENRKPGQGSG
jgi:hypothetical protein